MYYYGLSAFQGQQHKGSTSHNSYICWRGDDSQLPLRRKCPTITAIRGWFYQPTPSRALDGLNSFTTDSSMRSLSSAEQTVSRDFRFSVSVARHINCLSAYPARIIYIFPSSISEATPKSVMQVMGVPGLTLYHLKSHLQVCSTPMKSNCERNFASRGLVPIPDA